MIMVLEIVLFQELILLFFWRPIVIFIWNLACKVFIIYICTFSTTQMCVCTENQIVSIFSFTKLVYNAELEHTRYVSYRVVYVKPEYISIEWSF